MPDFAHGFVIHAGQNGDGDQASAVRAHRNSGADGLRGGLQHRRSAERVHVDQLHAGHCRGGKHRACNGIGNVVEFQVEEDAVVQVLAICFTASGPALVKSWLPILNMPTRSETFWANFIAVDKESKSRATIRLLRG